MKKMVLGSVVLSSLVTPPSVQDLLEHNFHMAFAIAEAQAKSNLALSPLGVYRFQQTILATEVPGTFSPAKSIPVNLEVVIKDIAGPVSCNLQPYRNSPKQEVQYSILFRVSFKDSLGAEKYIYSYPLMASFAKGSSSELVFFSDSGTTGCFLDNRVTFSFSEDFQDVHMTVEGLNESRERFSQFGLKGIQKLSDLNGTLLPENLTFTKN